jgi:hypothetical protein
MAWPPEARRMRVDGTDVVVLSPEAYKRLDSFRRQAGAQASQLKITSLQCAPDPLGFTRQRGRPDHRPGCCGGRREPEQRLAPCEVLRQDTRRQRGEHADCCIPCAATGAVSVHALLQRLRRAPEGRHRMTPPDHRKLRPGQRRRSARPPAAMQPQECPAACWQSVTLAPSHGIRSREHDRKPEGTGARRVRGGGRDLAAVPALISSDPRALAATP